MPTRDRTETQGMERPAGSSSRSMRDPYSSSGNYWDPFSRFHRLTEQMDRWFDTMGMGRSSSRMGSMSDTPWASSMWSPQMEAFMRNDQFVVRMDLPGLDKDDVNVEVTDNSVVIHGERQDTHEDEREGYYRSERSYGRFFREVPLPEGAQPETAKANYHDGVLEVSVTAPPRQVNKPRRIEIGAASPGDREQRERGTVPSSGSMPASERSSGRSSVAHDRGQSGESSE